MSYTVKGVPWSIGLATNVEDCKTTKDVMDKAKLNWKVAKCSLLAQMPIFGNTITNDEGFIYNGVNYVECPNAYAVYRTDKNIPLGIVKERYTPVQNVDAFSFFDDAIGKDKAIWQTAGYFGHGERVYVSAKLPKKIFVDGDPIDNYLVFITSHDGSLGVKILYTPIRFVCSNVLNAAVKEASNYISFRHTKSVHDNLAIATEILAMTNHKIENLAVEFNHMKKIKMSDAQAQAIFANVVLTEDEQFKIEQTGHTVQQVVLRDWRAINDAGISMKKVNVLSEMNNYYFTGIGQKEIVGTGYGVYNAVNGYYSNVDNTTGEKRMDSLLFGDKSRKIQLAGNLILAA